MGRHLTIGIAAAILAAACGPSFAPASAPATPCPTISAELFEQAIADGAANARATIQANGLVSMVDGPGIVQCATFKSAIRPCRRPNDFVIRYEKSGGEVLHVRVAAGQTYRFRLQAQPTPCEILEDRAAGAPQHPGG